MRNVLFMSLLGLSGAAFAASTATSATSAKSPAPVAATLTTTTITQIPAPKANISGAFSVGRSNSLYIEDGNSKYASWDFSGSMAYAMTSTLKATVLVEGSQDLKKEEDSDFAKGILGISYHKEKPVAPLFDFTPSFKVGFPVARSQRSDSLRNFFQIGLRSDVSPDYLFSKKLSIYATATGVRYVHDFSESASGKVNREYSSAQALNVGWNFTDALSFTVLYTHLDYWSYQGAMMEYMNHTEELGYQVTPAWSLTLGHSYGNPIVSARQADQQSYNTSLTDDQNSVVYGQIGYTF